MHAIVEKRKRDTAALAAQKNEEILATLQSTPKITPKGRHQTRTVNDLMRWQKKKDDVIKQKQELKEQEIEERGMVGIGKASFTSNIEMTLSATRLYKGEVFDTRMHQAAQALRIPDPGSP